VKARIRSDLSVRISPRKFLAINPENIYKQKAVETLKIRLYVTVERTTPLIAFFQDLESAPCNSADFSDVSRVALKFTHDRAIVSAKLYILITSVKRPMLSGPILLLMYALKLTDIPLMTILTEDRISAFFINSCFLFKINLSYVNSVIYQFYFFISRITIDFFVGDIV